MYGISDEEFTDFYDTIRPCKYCGDNQQCIRKDDLGIYIHCHNCKYDTLSYPTLSDAKGEWNEQKH